MIVYLLVIRWNTRWCHVKSPVIGYMTMNNGNNIQPVPVSYYLLILLALLPLPSSASSLSMIFLSSSLTTFLSVTLASLSVLLCSLHPCLSFLVLAGASIWSEGGNNRWWFHSRRAERDHHEPPYPPGLDVPLVLSAQVQLPSSGKDLPQGCT